MQDHLLNNNEEGDQKVRHTDEKRNDRNDLELCHHDGNSYHNILLGLNQISLHSGVIHFICLYIIQVYIIACLPIFVGLFIFMLKF